MNPCFSNDIITIFKRNNNEKNHRFGGWTIIFYGPNRNIPLNESGLVYIYPNPVNDVLYVDVDTRQSRCFIKWKTMKSNYQKNLFMIVAAKRQNGNQRRKNYHPAAGSICLFIFEEEILFLFLWFNYQYPYVPLS
jgi:hypothetical protein